MYNAILYFIFLMWNLNTTYLLWHLLPLVVILQFGFVKKRTIYCMTILISFIKHYSIHTIETKHFTNTFIYCTTDQWILEEIKTCSLFLNSLFIYSWLIPFYWSHINSINLSWLEKKVFLFRFTEYSINKLISNWSNLRYWIVNKLIYYWLSTNLI